MSATGEDQMISVGDLSLSLQHFGWADYFVFALMLTVCSAIGVYFGFLENISNKKNGARNLNERRGSEALDYLVGGRQMKVFPVSMSLVASYISGISLLGTSTEIYVYGTQFAFILVPVIISSFASWFIFLPVFHNLQLTSTYEYFELRFDKRIRLFGSVLFVVGTVMWLPIVIYVPALAFNQVTGINIHIVTPIVCIVCIFYTCVGGLKAVVWTDVIQSFVMVGSIILVMIKGTVDVGGLGEVLRRNAESDRLEMPHLTLDPTVRMSAIAIFIGGSLHWLQTCTTQVMVQRYLALPNLKKVKKTIIIYTIGMIFLLACCMYNGLLIFATYYKCDPVSTKLAKAYDQLVPLMVMDILGDFPGLPGIFVAGVFSAALSSLSTGLNSLAAVVLEDFVKPNISQPLSEKQTSIVMRSAVLFFGMLCTGLVFIVENMGMVVQLSASLGAVANGPLLAIFIMGMCLPWLNSSSALLGSVISFTIMCWICLKSQYDIFMGEMKFSQKPVSTEGCTYSFINSTVMSNANPVYIEELTWDPTARLSAISIFIGGTFAWMQSCTTQVMVQRYLALPDMKRVKNAVIIYTIGMIIILGCCIYNGLLIFATYYKCDPVSTKLAKNHDQLVPLMVMDILRGYPGIPGIFVAGVFSAALSSLSTGLNSLAAVILEDFCKPYLSRPLTERQTSILMRSVVLVFGFISTGLVFIVENMGMVVQLSSSLGAVPNGPLMAIFIMGMCLPWLTTPSVLTGSVVSFVVMCWICVKSQYDIYLGNIKFEHKPVFTEECTYSFVNTTVQSNASIIYINDLPNKSIHHISFLFHTAFGLVLAIIVAVLTSFVFGRQNPSDVDSNLLTPFLRKFIKPRKYLSVQPDIKERESIIRAYDLKDIGESVSS